MREYRAILNRESSFREVLGINFLDQAVLVSISGSYEWHLWRVLSRNTGLKDREGWDIYEGDIVIPHAYRKATGGEWIKFRCEVVFKQGMFMLRGPRISGEYPLSKSLQSGKSAGNEYEVIGNIYEHPELLK